MIMATRVKILSDETIEMLEEKINVYLGSEIKNNEVVRNIKFTIPSLLKFNTNYSALIIIDY